MDQSYLLAWMLSNTVVAAVLALLALGTERITKSPVIPHLLWVLVLVKLATPPLLSVPVQIEASRVDWIAELPAAAGNLFRKPVDDVQMHDDLMGTPAVATDTSLLQLGQALGADAGPTPQTWTTTATNLALYAWLVGSVAMACWIAMSALKIRFLVRHRGRLDRDATVFAQRVLSSSSDPHHQQNGRKLNPGPPVWLVNAVVSPMLVGFGGRAKIVFPEVLWHSLQPDARHALILHELEHYRRCDSIVRYVEAIVLVVAWWNPLVWIARSKIEDTEERCCDIAATSGPFVTARVYAESILTTLDFLAEPSKWYQHNVGVRPVASGVGPIRHLETRIRQVVSLGREDKSGRSCSGKVETRLRQIMSGEKHASRSQAIRLLFVSACLIALTMHPTISWTRTWSADESTDQVRAPIKSHGFMASDSGSPR